MNQLLLNKDFASKDFLRSSIKDFLVDLQADKCKNKQKILELCHVAKFLSFFEGNFKIERINEEPDFIISSSFEKFGLEHQILIDIDSKEKEGFIDNLFKQAERVLTQKNDIPLFLANITVNQAVEVKINDKKQKINEIVELILVFLSTGVLMENDIIEDISIMPHSKISLCPNFGGWCQKMITPDLLRNSIFKKERLVDNYIRRTGLKQWLLIVIGGVGESSYAFDCGFDVDFEIVSRFDKIFILEDFYYRLFEIK